MRRAARLALASLLLAFGGAGGPARAQPPLSEDALLRDHLWRELAVLPKERRPTVGLVLSAGSLRAVAHVGVITALEHAGFPIDVVAGTSMGAVMGSLYAGGRPLKRLRELATSIKASSGSDLGAFSLLALILSDRLLSSKATEKFIREELQGRRFEDLQKPFACVAMDLYSGEPIIFRQGDLAIAVRASMNLPGIFKPVEYRHRYLVDGGVVDYIPVDAARLLGADWTLASVTETDYTYSKPRNVLESLEQVIDIRGSLLSREQRKLADFLIEPPVGDIGLAEARRSGEAVKKGTIAAWRRMDAAKESLLLFSLGRLLADYLPPEAKARGGRR